jgi:hypothetical protein
MHKETTGTSQSLAWGVMSSGGQPASERSTLMQTGNE